MNTTTIPSSADISATMQTLAQLIRQARRDPSYFATMTTHVLTNVEEILRHLGDTLGIDVPPPLPATQENTHFNLHPTIAEITLAGATLGQLAEKVAAQGNATVTPTVRILLNAAALLENLANGIEIPGLRKPTTSPYPCADEVLRGAIKRAPMSSAEDFTINGVLRHTQLHPHFFEGCSWDNPVAALTKAAANASRHGSAAAHLLLLSAAKVAEENPAWFGDNH